MAHDSLLISLWYISSALSLCFLMQNRKVLFLTCMVFAFFLYFLQDRLSIDLSFGWTMLEEASVFLAIGIVLFGAYTFIRKELGENNHDGTDAM